MLVSVLLSSCFGGSDDSGTSASNGDDTSQNDQVTSEIFNSPSYTANWGVLGVFANATTCASCHTGNGATVMEFNGKDISPATQWKHGVMAHSLNDPYYNAAVEEEGHLFPDKKVFIENTCLRCHAPMGYTHAHQNPELLVPDPTGLLSDGGYAFETAMTDPHSREGISCTACHQMQDSMVGGEVPVSNMSGNYKINSPDENVTNPKIFGPIVLNPYYQAMQNATQYIPEYAAHMSDSAKCATCHNLYTPTLNLDGELHKIDPATGNYDPTGQIAQFPEQAPYWEWLNSRYLADGKTCQVCHMPEPVSSPPYQTAVTTRPANAWERSNFSQHEMVGGNTYLLGLLSKYMVELGIADKTTEAGFNEKIAQTHSMLRKAVDFTLSQSLSGNTLTVPVVITNNAGHKLPTSFPSRRVWVHLKVTDSAGQLVFESGKHEEGRIEGKDDLFTSSTCLSSHKITGFDSLTNQCYEPHHDEITSSDQVMIYEDVLGDVNQDITHVLLHARQYIKDNRIPPKGWTEAGRHQNPVDQTLYDDDIVGAAVNDPNFAAGKAGAGSDGKDTVTYKVNTTGFTAPFSVEAELLYQTIRPSFVDSMHADEEIEGNSYVGRFKEMYEKTPPEPEVLAAYPPL